MKQKKNEKEIELHKKGKEEEAKLGELEEYFLKKKREINRYFGSIEFYGNIDDKIYHCDMNIPTINELEDKKNEFLKNLEEYYDKKKKEKKDSWQSQINRAKYKSRCQAQGTLKCENGHELNGDSISCGGSCKGKLYWVDGPTHYSICEDCGCVSKLTTLVCSRCNARSYCTPKFTDYMP